jgi:hypothetical protein
MCDPSHGEFLVRFLFMMAGAVAMLGVLVGAKML